MSATEVHNESGDAGVGKVDLQLEVQVFPVSDVNRSKEFYERLGWRLDEDVAPMPGLRIVQFTPPGSWTSVDFGEGLTTAAPGAAEATLVVTDIEAAHGELVGRGIEVSDIWHGPPFPVEARQPGPDPERASYGSFFSFADPDGNTWITQEVTTRHPGRLNGAETGYVSTADLEAALRRAEVAHRELEKRTRESHLPHRSREGEDWPAWYAWYMVAEQTGTDLPLVTDS
jgi:catechol 2,3-dioxygenase-like lactoylglutathione lyase family enzyme